MSALHEESLMFSIPGEVWQAAYKYQQEHPDYVLPIFADRSSYLDNTAKSFALAAIRVEKAILKG